MIKILLAATGLVAISTLAVGAVAHPVIDPDQPPHALVSTANLDLGTRDGRRMLGRRINRAVTSVCGTAQTYGLQARALDLKCRANAWGMARPAITAMVVRARRDVPVVALIARSNPRGLPADQVPANADQARPVEALTAEEAADIFRFPGSR